MVNVNGMLEEVRATQEIEGLKVSEETEEILRECIAGKRSFEDARNEALEQIKKSLGM